MANENEKEIKEVPFTFLDEKLESQQFFKVLEKVGEDEYRNTIYNEKFKYELYEDHVIRDAPLDRSTHGKGFYSFIGLEAAINNSRYKLDKIVSGEFTIHSVQPSEICGKSASSVRSRRIVIHAPFTLEEVMRHITGYSMSEEEIIDKYVKHQNELNRFSALKGIIDAKANEVQKEEMVKLNKELIETYWKRYDKFVPIFERTEISHRIFDLLRLPSKFSDIDEQRSFEDFNKHKDFSKTLDDLDLALAVIKDTLYKESSSIKSFTQRAKRKFDKIIADAQRELNHAEGVMETHKDLLDQINNIDKILYNDWSLRKVKSQTRQRYEFSLSHLSTKGKEKAERIQIHDESD